MNETPPAQGGFFCAKHKYKVPVGSAYGHLSGLAGSAKIRILEQGIHTKQNQKQKMR